MIKFKRDGKTVFVQVDSDLPSTEDETMELFYHFNYIAASNQEAELLLRYFSQRFGDRIASIRKEEFMSG